MSAASATAPLQPADLRLRGKPPRVMRLSRKALATVGMVAAAGIGGSLIYALQPGTQTAPTELYDTDNRATTDGLSAAPKDYSEVPKLGPPLPGDLGRPILSAQQRGTDVAPPPMGTPSPPASAAPSPGQTARERARNEQDAARTSRMFIGSAAPTPSGPAANGPPPAIAEGAVGPLPPPATGQGEQAAKRAFFGSGDTAASESGFRVIAPSSGSIVQAGSIIPAALITGIRSDLPGMITAQVTENVYDSVTGRHLLIPQGSRLLGDYDSQVSLGQSRVLLAWTRLILPDGRSIHLDRLPATDAAGYAGLQGRVNHHWGGIFRSALISTLLSIGTEVGSASDDDLVRAIRQGGSQSIGRTGQDLVRRQMGIQPTLEIRPGFPLRVIVTRDLVLLSHGVAE